MVGQREAPRDAWLCLCGRSHRGDVQVWVASSPAGITRGGNERYIGRETLESSA